MVEDKTDFQVIQDTCQIGGLGQGLGQDQGHGLVQGQDPGQGRIPDHHLWTEEERDGPQRDGEGATVPGICTGLTILLPVTTATDVFFFF